MILMHKKICPCCGDVFFAFNPKRIFCSKNCAGKYRRQTAEQRICEFCGKTFHITPYNFTQKFCSLKCFYDSKKQTEGTVVRVDKTFDDWIREAEDCHLDYGTYRSLIKMGKTYEELKAVAHLRPIALHAHASTASRKNYRD